MPKNKEIISVAVFSYNSSMTIIETLNSILNQDYGSQYIELLIGDDASLDNSQALIDEWLLLHKKFFYGVKLNIHALNKGIVSNFNNTCKLSSAKWLKPIAADDLLESNCISEFHKYTSSYDVECIFCKVTKFNEFGCIDVIPKNISHFYNSAEKQFRSLLIDNFVPAPGSFIKTSLLKKINYVESDMLIEDYPLWLRITSLNIKLYLIEKNLVKYRIGNSLSNSDTKLININMNKNVYQCKIKYLSYVTQKKAIKYLLYIDIQLSRLNDIIKIYIFKNRKNKISKLLSSTPRLLSPLYILRKLTKFKLHHFINKN